MKLTSEKDPLLRRLALPFAVVALFGILVLRSHPEVILRLASCPLRENTGIPCPTCGGTHCLLALFNGHIAEALVANPFVVAGTLALGLWVLYGLVATAIPSLRISMTLSSREKRTASFLAILLFVGTWVWKLWQTF